MHRPSLMPAGPTSPAQFNQFPVLVHQSKLCKTRQKSNSLVLSVCSSMQPADTTYRYATSVAGLKEFKAMTEATEKQLKAVAASEIKEIQAVGREVKGQCPRA